MSEAFLIRDKSIPLFTELVLQSKFRYLILENQRKVKVFGAQFIFARLIRELFHLHQ